MCTAAEAKTLQRVHGRYNSFFRKVIPIKRVQKPVRWYTRLPVYGNPGRVVNGCAPGIPVLICGFGVVVCGGVLRRVRRSSSFLSPGIRMRPVRTFLRSYRGTHPLGRSALSLLRCGEHPRGYPDVASGRCAGTLRQRGRERLLEVHVRKTRPHPHSTPARKGGIVRSDIRVPEAKRGRVPCRNEDDNRLSKRSKAEHCLFKRNRASPAEPSVPGLSKRKLRS